MRETMNTTILLHGRFYFAAIYIADYDDVIWLTINKCNPLMNEAYCLKKNKQIFVFGVDDGKGCLFSRVWYKRRQSLLKNFSFRRELKSVVTKSTFE